MMKTIIMMKGLPGSGKSTWAKKFMNKQPKNSWKRINKDTLRECFDHGVYTSGNEDLIIKARNVLMELFLEEGKNVIIDDTNLHPKHEVYIKGIANKYNASFKIKSFEHVSIEDCIRNDLKRLNSVGEKVIRDMHSKIVADVAQVATYREDTKLPKVIICDIDGTVAKMGGRSPYEWDRVDEDSPNVPVVATVKALQQSGYKIIFMTGRDGNDECKQLTMDWIMDHFHWTPGKEFELFMRNAGDNRKDAIIKKELFEEHIRGKYYVECTIDDRDAMVFLWRCELGLTCMQVGYGNF